MQKPVVAIVGRSNVGKSTLFNRLNSEEIKKNAIVYSIPGVTRDRNYASGEWKDYKFWLVDTGGIELLSQEEDNIISLMKKQAEIAIAEADLVLFLVDKMTGLIPSDLEVARLLIRAQKKTLVVVNKCEIFLEKNWTDSQVPEFYELGLGDPIPISALHGLNINELLDQITQQITPYYEEVATQPFSYIAIVGKPNVGKSSLLNTILGQERVIVDSTPGTTRDAIDTHWTWNKRDFVFIDTAGIRKKSKVFDEVEKYSLLRSLNSIEKSSVTLLIIDALEGVSLQDKRILSKMVDVGCGGVIVVNKWDLIKEQAKERNLKIEDVREEFKKSIESQLPYLRYFPIIFISALKDQGMLRLMGLIEKVALEHSRWINTGQFNKVIMDVYKKSHPPSFKGKWLKIYYATQIKASPPSFLLFVNQPLWMNDAYLRYLQKELRQRLGFVGTPVRILVRKR